MSDRDIAELDATLKAMIDALNQPEADT